MKQITPKEGCFIVHDDKGWIFPFSRNGRAFDIYNKNHKEWRNATQKEIEWYNTQGVLHEQPIIPLPVQDPINYVFEAFCHNLVNNIDPFGTLPQQTIIENEIPRLIYEYMFSEYGKHCPFIVRDCVVEQVAQTFSVVMTHEWRSHEFERTVVISRPCDDSFETEITLLLDDAMSELGKCAITKRIQKIKDEM